MRRILFFVFSLLFLLFIFQLKTTSVQAACVCRQYGCNIGETEEDLCSGGRVYCCSSTNPNPTATPNPAATATPKPTATPAGGSAGSGCRDANGKVKPNACSTTCNSCLGSCSATCNYDGSCASTCNVTDTSCTGGGGTWGGWGACDSTGYQARFCSNDSTIYEIQACQPPTPTGNAGGGGGATNTPGAGATNTPIPPTAVPTPTTGPGTWIKLKDSSFVSINGLYQAIPAAPAVYDSGDTTEDYFIIGSNGIGLASSINLTSLNPNAKLSSSDWQTNYDRSSYSMSSANFLGYIKARKEFEEIINISQINKDGIYLYSGSDPLNFATVPGEFNQYNVVLVSEGTINLNMSDFNPTRSIALIAPNVNFSATTTAANGIFIGSTINTGTTANQGLKITGNLIAQGTFVNSRNWTNANIPSIFIVFDPSLYLDLLPYLSVANYDWKQLQ